MSTPPTEAERSPDLPWPSDRLASTERVERVSWTRRDAVGRWIASNPVARSLLKFRALILAILHCAAFAMIFPLVYHLRFDWEIPKADQSSMLTVLPWVVLIKLAVFGAMGGLRGWWRYATFADVVRLVEAATLSTVAVVAAGYLFRYGLRTPRSVIVMDWAGTILSLGSLRCSTRLFRERYYPMMRAKKCEQAVVIGASEASLTLVRMLQSQQSLGLKVVGLLDSNVRLNGQVMAACG